MKKTLSALTLTAICGALTGTASGADYSITANFTAADDAPSSVVAGSSYVPNVNVVEGNSLVLEDIVLSANGEGRNQAVTMTDYTKSILLVGNNIGNGTEGNSSSATYTISFTAGADYTLTELKLALLTHNGGGKNHSSQPVFKWSVSLGSDELASEEHQATATTDNNQGITSAPVYDFDANTITNGSGAIVTLSDLNLDLRQGEHYDINVVISDDLTSTFTSGYFVGLGGFSMKGTDPVVPEPTTATLSLLALAALSARRRRR